MRGQLGRRRRRWLIAYAVVTLTLWAGGTALVAVRSPGLISERARPGPGGIEGMPREATLYGLPWLAHLVLAWIDRPGRFGLPAVPTPLQAIGLLGYIATTLVIIWAEVANPFFSSAVRIQPERGQHVISTGPYAVVRHPGYAAGMVYVLLSGLALGSWLAVMPGVAFSLAVLRRARVEDEFLQRNLPGYTQYARRVRFRLVPALW